MVICSRYGLNRIESIYLAGPTVRAEGSIQMPGGYVFVRVRPFKDTKTGTEPMAISFNVHMRHRPKENVMPVSLEVHLF